MDTGFTVHSITSGCIGGSISNGLFILFNPFRRRQNDFAAFRGYNPSRVNIDITDSDKVNDVLGVTNVFKLQSPFRSTI